MDKGIEWMENILIIIKQLDNNSHTDIEKNLAWKFNSNYLPSKYCHMVENWMKNDHKEKILKNANKDIYYGHLNLNGCYMRR